MKKFEAHRYVGRWWELGRYPFAWEDSILGAEKTCMAATADYSYSRGHLNIRNSCYDDDNLIISVKDAYGEMILPKQIVFNGVTITPLAAFNVVFDSTLEYRVGEYTLVYTNYDMVAIVISSKENLAWILIRDKSLDITYINTIMSIASGFGINIKKLIIHDM